MGNDDKMTLLELRQAKQEIEDEVARRLAEFSQRTGVKVSEIGLSLIVQRKGTGYLVNLRLELG